MTCARRSPQSASGSSGVSLSLVKVTKTATYTLPCDEIMAIISDETFQDEKCRQTFAIDWTASVGTRGARTIVTTERAMPTDPLPDIARGFIGSRFVIHETQAWTGPNPAGVYTADLRLHVQGAPMTGAGTRHLIPDGAGGSRDEITIHIRAAVPIIGRKIEEAAAPIVAAAAEIETELLGSWSEE